MEMYLPATLIVNKEAIHIITNFNCMFYKLLWVTLSRENTAFTQNTKMFHMKHSNGSKLLSLTLIKFTTFFFLKINSGNSYQQVQHSFLSYNFMVQDCRN